MTFLLNLEVAYIARMVCS